MKTEIRKILEDKTETLEDGRVVIVPDFSQLDDLVDDLNALFSLHGVSQQRELLVDCLRKMSRYDFEFTPTTEYVDDYLKSTNCG